MKNIIVICILCFYALCGNAKDGNTRATEEKGLPELIPLEYFAKLPKFSTPVISPYGNKMAATLTFEGKETVVMMDYKAGKKFEISNFVPLHSGDRFFNWYRWANDERLVLSIRSVKKWRHFVLTPWRVASVGSDGDGFFFIKTESNKWGWYKQNSEVVSWLDEDPKHIIASLDTKVIDATRSSFPIVHKVNLYTGKRELIQDTTNHHIRHWIGDAQGNIRVGVAYPRIDRSNTKVKIYYREAEKKFWDVMQNSGYFENASLYPSFILDEDPNILLVTSDDLVNDENDEDDVDYFQYDLKQRKVLGPYVDNEAKKIKAMVKKAIPEAKVYLVSEDKEKNRFIIKVYADTIPAQYFFYNKKENQFLLVGREYPDLMNKPLAKMRRLTYKARDGLTIPAFLTLPKDAKEKNVPVIVYPHGGPWARDYWGFDRYVQFLANRGYAVFQPQFRGSTGYGAAHEEAGYKQWGLGIQDDITDGVKWLIEEGIADPERICIMGGSFGGYAAAFGLVKTPELYRCGLSVNGVMDFPEKIRKIDFYLYSGINKAITNSKYDAKELSPYHQAKKIKAPLMLLHGDKDAVVPFRHSEKMAKKMRKLKKDVEFIPLQGGEHWRTTEPNELIKFKAMERFFAKHLGGRTTAK